MARGSKKGKGIIIVIDILLFLVLIGSCVGNYFLITKTNSKKKELKSMQEEYKEEKKNYDAKAKEVTSVADELKKYEKIDELVVNSKKEYFSSIKEVEDAIKAGKTKSKIAYITFDDGPYNSTWKVLDILDQ